MIDRAVPYDPGSVLSGHTGAKAGKVLRMRQGDRTAGSIPVWENASTAKSRTELALSDATNEADNFKKALSYSSQKEEAAKEKRRPFGFADLVDIVNPLQHIPIVSFLYREITHDEILPSGKIVGGAIFGGFAGAGAGLASLIVEHETGRDIPAAVGHLIAHGKMPRRDDRSDSLPDELIAFTDLQKNPPANLSGDQPSWLRPPKRPIWERG